MRLLAEQRVTECWRIRERHVEAVHRLAPLQFRDRLRREFAGVVRRQRHILAILRRDGGDERGELLCGFMVSDVGSGDVELADITAVAEEKDATLREVVFSLPELARRRCGLAEVAAFGGHRRDAEFARRGVRAVEGERDAGFLRGDGAGVGPGAILGVR